MHAHYHYSTVSEAIAELRAKGYDTDFNLEENCLVCHSGRFNPDEFDITEVYRYEGNTDPADEATVYAIASKNGIKGILVTGYGANMDGMSEEMLRRLQ